MSSLRQQIYDNVETRFKTITTANGYTTNIGSSVLKWREFATVNTSEMPCIVIEDVKEVPELIGVGKQASQKRVLTIEYHILTTGTDTATIMTNTRSAEADVENAIKTDVTWSGLARYTVPKDNAMGFSDKTSADIVGVLTGSFEIQYLTGYFNPTA